MFKTAKECYCIVTAAETFMYPLQLGVCLFDTVFVIINIISNNILLFISSYYTFIREHQLAQKLEERKEKEGQKAIEEEEKEARLEALRAQVCTAKMSFWTKYS